MKTWNKRIATRRVMLGMKQIALAKAVGVTRSSVSLWESGKIETLTSRNIGQICNVLRIHPAWLLNGTMPMEVDQPAHIAQPVENIASQFDDEGLGMLIRSYSAAPDWLRAAMLNVCRWLIAVDQATLPALLSMIRDSIFNGLPDEFVATEQAPQPQQANQQTNRQAQAVLWRAFEAANEDTRDLILMQLGLFQTSTVDTSETPHAALPALAKVKHVK